MLTSPKNILCFFASPLLRVMLFVFKLNCRNADRLTSYIAAAEGKFSSCSSSSSSSKNHFGLKPSALKS